jgi:hypothetical protein
MTTIGSGWTGVNTNGKTIISIQIDEVLKEMIPQLKNVKFGLTQMLQSERTSEKSPHWKVYAYVPQQNNNAEKAEEANKAITAEAQQNAETFEYDEYAYESTSQL